MPAPAAGAGNWTGAASAVLVDGEFWLAYRVRRPLHEGRGVSVVVARSTDGVLFEPVTEVFRDQFGAESFERPVILRRPDGGWRLYVSCATPATQALVDRGDRRRHPRGPRDGPRTVVLPGDDTLAVKDPVIAVDGRPLAAWVCCHPLTEPGHEDRMSTAYCTSTDGLQWDWHGDVLTPDRAVGPAWRPGDGGAAGRAADVAYDGRATAEDNWHEVTGIADATATSSRERHRTGRPLAALRRGVPLPEHRRPVRRTNPLLLRGSPARRRARPAHVGLRLNRQPAASATSALAALGERRTVAVRAPVGRTTRRSPARAARCRRGTGRAAARVAPASASVVRHHPCPGAVGSAAC